MITAAGPAEAAIEAALRRDRYIVIAGIAGIAAIEAALRRDRYIVIAGIAGLPGLPQSHGPTLSISTVPTAAWPWE